MKHRKNARLALVLLVFAFFLLAVALLTADVKAGNGEDPVTQSGRMPDDDIPATERCYMTDEEIQEDCENFYIEQVLLEKAHKIENVMVTYYCICEKCCGKSPDAPAYGITASGLKATPGVSVAVDTSIIPLFSDILLDYGDGELHYMRADDTGAFVNGNHIDVCVGSHAEALQLGVTEAAVYWVNDNV